MGHFKAVILAYISTELFSTFGGPSTNVRLNDPSKLGNFFV
jgi:hypothetical protein